MRKLPCQRREPFLQRSRANLAEIHENESLPQTEVHRMQRIIGLIKPGNVVHVRRADQSSIERVSPCVIRTLNRGRMSALILAEPRPAMTANVVKCADRRIFYPGRRSNFRRRLPKKIITGSCDLILMPNQHPLLGKNLLLFLGKNFGRDKIALRQALGAGRECVSRLARRWRYIGVHRWDLRMLHAACVCVNAVIAHAPPDLSQRPSWVRGDLLT